MIGSLDLGCGHKVSQSKPLSYIIILARFSTHENEIKFGVEAVQAQHADATFE